MWAYLISTASLSSVESDAGVSRDRWSRAVAFEVNFMQLPELKDLGVPRQLDGRRRAEGQTPANLMSLRSSGLNRA